MLLKVNSSELISYLAKKDKRDKIEIEINYVRELGHKLERSNPSIVFDGDKYTIESFRCLCSEKITVSSTTITFEKSQVTKVISKNMPSLEISALLKKIEEEAR